MAIRYLQGKDWNEQWNTFEDWKKQWGCLELNWLCNQWISCAYIGGPYGWISPNGEVGGLFDIGKYPSVEEVEEDLKEIATAFPFLEFTIYMVDEVYEETIDVDAEWEVKNGTVTLINKNYSVSDLEFTGIHQKQRHRL